MSQQLVRFGTNGVVLRNGNQPLDIEQIRTYAPSVFATERHSSRSEKFAYIPTHSLFDRMLQEGFLPMEVRQGGSRDEEKRGYTKHMIRFRQQNITPVLNDTFPEIALINAHDGTSAWHAYAAWFRLTCLNGMVVCEEMGPSIKVPHRGNVDDVIEATYTVVEGFAKQREQIQQMAETPLTTDEQFIFARAASELRFREDQEVRLAELLAPRRSQDQGDSLWLTMNRVQERLLNGGVVTTVRRTNGQQQLRRSRRVNSVSENVGLNQALWRLATEMQKLKTN